MLARGDKGYNGSMWPSLEVPLFHLQWHQSQREACQCKWINSNYFHSRPYVDHCIIYRRPVSCTIKVPSSFRICTRCWNLDDEGYNGSIWLPMEVLLFHLRWHESQREPFHFKWGNSIFIRGHMLIIRSFIVAPVSRNVLASSTSQVTKLLTRYIRESWVWLGADPWIWTTPLNYTFIASKILYINTHCAFA